MNVAPRSLIGRNQTLRLALVVAAPLALAAGCEAPPGGGVEIDVDVTESSAIGTENGLRTFNGLQTFNGLRTFNGLSTGTNLAPTSVLMSSAHGRTTASYLIRCALPAGRTITKTSSDGVTHTFSGQIGLAPAWENGTCDKNCQEWVSACMLSMVNTAGRHVPLWMMASHPAIGFGKISKDYPRQEGAYFGNLFLETPRPYYCTGRDFLRNPPLGRIGSGQIDPPYIDPFVFPGTCAMNCKTSRESGPDAFASCGPWDKVITIFRQ